MSTQRKIFTPGSFEWKTENDGTFRCAFSKLNVTDKDGDVTFPGAAPSGKSVLVSSYGHRSWYGELPVGDGTVKEDGEWLVLDGEFWLDTPDGDRHYKAVKRASAKGLQEWSYAYDVTAAAFDGDPRMQLFEGAYRGILAMDIFEVSPVLRGAGEDTHTEFVKSMQTPFADHGDQVLAHLKSWVERSRELATLRAKEGRPFPAPHRERMRALAALLRDASADVDGLLATADPERERKAAEEVERIALAFATPDPRMAARPLIRI